MSQPLSETSPPPPQADAQASPPAPSAAAPDAGEPPRMPCPAPANFRAEVAAYDKEARTGVWEGPRYRMTYRELGEGPPLVLVPGIAGTYRCYSLLLNRLASRFRTIVYDYPGEHPDDRARLRKITHENLVDDVFGLIDHLQIGRAFLVGLSFGTTVTLRALHREPRRFPRAVLQGAFAKRHFTVPERLALQVGRLMPGHVGRLPLRDTVLAYNNKCHFPSIMADRWDHYLEQNARTPIAALAHRLDLIAGVDLRPIIGEIPTEILLLQGNEDRIVPRRYFDELREKLRSAQAVVMPLVGHQPFYTHAEALASTIVEYALPCAPGGCPNEAQQPTAEMESM